jgi:chromosome segregation ATPase
VLQDAKVKLKELTHNAEDLTRKSASNFDLNKLQDELIILREENVSLLQELKQKNELLEQLRQKNDELKENDLSICLKNMKEELISLQRSNFLSTEQLKIKDEILEKHIKQTEELKSEKEQILKYIEKCHKQMKQQNKKFTNIDTCMIDVNKAQEQENLMKEANVMCSLEVWDQANFSEILKQSSENLCAVQEPNVKYIEHLQEKEECHEHLQHPCKEVKEGGPKSQELSYVYDELKALTEINFVCIEKLREKHEYFETLKHQIEEADLKYIDKLQKKDTYLEQLKEQIEDLKERALNTQELCREKVLNSATENGLMGTEVKAKNEYLEMLETVTDHNTELIFAEEGIKILKDQGMWYDQGLTEKDTHCEILKKHSEHWGSVEIASSKYIDELKEKIENMQKEITVLKEEKSLTIKAIKEKDSYLETLKKQIQNLDSTIEANSKYIDEMKTDNITVQKENDSLGEKHSLYREQLRQKDNCLEIMKQQIEELTAEREANLTCIEVLKANTVSLQTEILSLQENNSLYMGLVKERNDCLETLKQQIEDLNCAREKNLKYIDELRCNSECLQKEIICVEEKNSVYMDQLKEEDDHLEALKHKVEDLNCERETNLQHIDELKANNECLQKEVLSSEEKNSVYMEQLKENDNYLEALKREIQDLNYARETNLKDIDELKANNGCLQKEIVSLERKNSVYIETLKQQIEDLNCARETNLKYIDELRCNNECLQKEIISLEEKNSVYMDQLKEEDNHLEALKHEVEDLNCERETNLQHIDELKANNECLQKEVVSSEEKNSVYMEQLKEKDNYLEALKREIQDLNCSREINLKDNDELKANNECLQKEIFSLEEKNSVYIEQLKEKDNHLETLKQETEHLISEREENLKDIDELKTNIVNLQSEINSLQEYNIMHMRQVREKDNCLETLKKQLEELDCHREANLTSIDELKANIVNLQKEVLSLEEKYSMFSEEVKGKDNYLQRLKNHVEDMNSGREKNLKYIDELESNNASLQMQIHSLAERNSVYMEQVKEKDKCLETLKQETEDLNCAREANLKYIDDLRSNNEHLQKEIISLEEKNSVYMEQLKEKDNYLEALKHEVEDLNCMRETNLKHIDELKANNECLKKEIISLEEKSSVYMEQLKEKDNGLETVQQEFEGIAYARETNLECGDELQFNIRLGKEVNSINAENAMYREQLKEKDIYIEALKQQIEDVNSLSKANLKCTEQVHEKNKCCDSLKYEKEPESQEYVVLAEEVECCNTHVPSELSEMTRILSVKSDEIELCQRMMLKEVSHLKPDYDMGSLSQSQPTDLLKMLLALVMEKEKEVFLSLQDEMNEIRSQANEAEKEYANKDKQKDCWIRELETEIEHLQAHVARAEEEKKALEMADKSHCLALLEQERADLMKKFGKMDSDLVVIRQERDHVDSHNKEMARKLEDVQLLLEKKSSQLQEEMENQFSKSPKLETLMKEISDLGENNAVLRERLEKTDNDNNLLLKKVEDLQCALMLKNNENLDMVRKLDSLERELKVLSTKNCALEEEIIANKEVHSLLLKEKDHWSQITLNLKKVTEDVENLRVKELVWDSEKEQLQTQLAAKQNELSLERDIRWRLENDMKTNIQKVEEEKDQLQVSYSHLLQNYETLKGEDKHSHQMKQVQSLNVSDCMSQKSEITVAEPDENLVLKKQLEEELEKQKELSRKCENLATCITGLKEEVNRLCNENVSLRESLKILSAEENRLNALMHTKESELESFKRQLEKSVHGKAASVLAFQCIKEPTQQREKALGCKNKDYSSSLSANGSCTESLHSRQQFSVRVAHRMAEECGTAISEERKLKEQLKICMEENMALSNKNEQLATDTHGLQKMLERYRVDNNALEKSLEILEEEKKGLLSQLSDTRKRLFNVESEVRELKLKIVAMRKDEASQDNIVLRFRVKELEAEVERLQIRKKSLLREGQSVGHNISKRHALYCQVQSQLAETTSVLKSSVATNTDISGTVCCVFFTKCVLANWSVWLLSHFKNY